MLRSTEAASLAWVGSSVVVSGVGSLVTLVAFLNVRCAWTGFWSAALSGTADAPGKVRRAWFELEQACELLATRRAAFEPSEPDQRMRDGVLHAGEVACRFDSPG